MGQLKRTKNYVIASFKPDEWLQWNVPQTGTPGASVLRQIVQDRAGLKMEEIQQAAVLYSQDEYRVIFILGGMSEKEILQLLQQNR